MTKASQEGIEHGMQRMTRRRLMKVGAGIAGAAGALSAGIIDAGAVSAAAPRIIAASRGADAGRGDVDRASLQKAYLFLNTMMDAYQSGSTLRLAQSYSDQQGLNSTAFIYDNALQIIAYLGRRTPEDLARARILGDSLLYAQIHDPNPAYTDGRLRDSYFVAPSFITAASGGPVQLDGAPAYLNGTAVGNVAWAGLALARLYAYTGGRSYLDGALKLGAWIVNNAYDSSGYGGYKFGVNADNSPSANGKSTEHNIDTYAFFVELSQLTGNQIYAGLTQPQPWSILAQHALDFVHSMWEPTGGHFWTGTKPDGTINTYPIPEDVQTWSYLALEDPAYAASLDWASARLAVTDTPEARNATFTGNVNFSGVTFSNGSMQADPTTAPNSYTPKPDLSAVWFEGTAHIANALLFRDTRDNSTTVIGDDSALAAFYLSNIQRAQAVLGQNQTVGGKALLPGYGIVASSSPLDTGFGFDYFPNLHIGATSWYLIAAQRVNPYRLNGHGAR